MSELLTCSVEGCEATKPRGRPSMGWGLGYCNKHRLRFKKYGDALTTPGHPKGEQHPSWQEDVSYHAVHLRLKAERGPARGYDCRLCGDQAQAWAHDNDASDPLYREGPHGAYTTDLSHYMALCRPCHIRMDERRLEVAHV